MIELNHSGYRAVILPERGGSCVDLSRWEAHALRTPQDAACFRHDPFLYGTPLLFFPNRISGGRFTFEDRLYTLPVNEPATGCFLHGTLHETAFEVLRQRPDYAALGFRATGRTPYLTFPHAFTLALEWALNERGLHQKVTITNDSDRNMPVALAFHTTFRLPFVPESDPAQIRLQLDTCAEFGRNMQTYLPDGRVWQDFPNRTALETGTFLPALQKISRLFRMGQRRQMRLTDPAAGLQIHYQVSDSYGYWMVYRAENADYLCVEPQSWLSNCPNAPFDRYKHGFTWIAPGKTETYETQLSMERL